MSKRKRGRPQGGRHPEPIRQYWRDIQRSYRQAQKMIRLPSQQKRKRRRS